MIKFAAAAGALNERLVVRETLGAFKRAGADLILSVLCPRCDPRGFLTTSAQMADELRSAANPRQNDYRE